MTWKKIWNQTVRQNVAKSVQISPTSQKNEYVSESFIKEIDVRRIFLFLIQRIEEDLSI